MSDLEQVLRSTVDHEALSSRASLLLDTLHRSILFFSTQKNDLREKFARSKSNIVTGHCRTPAAEYLELELAARQELLPFWLQVRSSLPFSLFCCGCADRQEATDAIGSCGRLADDLIVRRQGCLASALRDSRYTQPIAVIGWSIYEQQI
jgi:hypothetical protein